MAEQPKNIKSVVNDYCSTKASKYKMDEEKTLFQRGGKHGIQTFKFTAELDACFFMTELGSSGIDQSDCSGSVRTLTLCSDSNGHVCLICTEMFDSHGDHRATSLRCNHTLCRRCVDEIMAQARDYSRLQCPFCRQTTLFSQQEELHSNSTYNGIISPSPGPWTVPTSPLSCVAVEMQVQESTFEAICGLCLKMTGILLLILMVICVFLFSKVPELFTHPLHTSDDIATVSTPS